MIRRVRASLAARLRRDQSGFTLVEVIIAIVLSTAIAGSIVVALTTALNASSTSRDRAAQSNDAQLISAFLVRDAQAAGGSDPATAQQDPTIGVSTTDAAGCTAPGTLRIRFSWKDRQSSSSFTSMVSTWWLNGTELTRHVCANGVAQSDVVVARNVATADPVCAAGCDGLPSSVTMNITSITTTSGVAPFAYSLRATVRSQAQPLPSPSGANAIALFALGDANGCGISTFIASVHVNGDVVVDSAGSGSCSAVQVSLAALTVAAGELKIFGNGACSTFFGSCPAVTHYSPKIGDPLAGRTPPAGTGPCNASTPAPPKVGGVWQPGTYFNNGNPVSITQNATFAPGEYVFCNGVNISARVTGSGVLWYLPTGTMNVFLGGDVAFTPPTSGPLAGILLWVASSQTLNMIFGGGFGDTYSGIVYAPNANVAFTLDAASQVGGLIARRVNFTGSSGAHFGPIVTVTVSPVSLPNGQVGTSYGNQQLSAFGGYAPYDWSWTTATRPPGLSLNANTGVISGTPTTAGTYTFDVTASDAQNNTGTQTYTVTIAPKPVSIVGPASLPVGLQGVPYSATINAQDGTPPYTWSISAGSLPNGLTLNPATGVISGSTAFVGDAPLTVTVQDATGGSASKNYVLKIVSPVFVTGPTTMPTWTAGKAYPSTTATATGGGGVYSWSMTGNTGSGLSINASTGVISGIPNAGTYNLVIRAQDQYTVSNTITVPVTINPALVIAPAFDLPDWTVNRPYPPQTATVTGGTGTVRTWSATGLPTGLTMSSAGVVSGTPTQLGLRSVVVTVTDEIGASASRTIPMTINANPAITTATLANGSINLAYTTTLAATGTTPFTWSATGLPAGLSINATSGVISGTPTTAGTANVTVTVTDAAGVTGNRSYTLVINAPITITGPTTINWTEDRPLSVTATATGGGGTRTWSESGLPWNGLSLNSSTGVISGTPTNNLTNTITLRVTDSTGFDEQTVAIVINNPVDIANGFTLPTSTVGRPYESGTPSTVAGTAPFTWTANGLPTGLSINPSTGVVSGTPTQLGTRTVEIRVTDVTGDWDENDYSITIRPVPSITAPTTLPNWTVGRAYPNTTASVSSTTGTAPFTWSATGLPAGLTINAGNGTISGTPSTAGTFNVVITVTDDAGATDTQTINGVVISPALAITTPTSLPSWTAGRAYPTTTAIATGGTGAKVWSATGLPTGMTINSASGAITGTPTQTGTRNVTITVTDAVGATDSTVLSITINTAVTVSASFDLPDWTANVTYPTTTATATGGTGTITWSATGLPAGLTINSSTGAVSGTPTTPGSSSVVVTATDSVGATGTRTVPVVINAQPNITTTTLPAWTVGRAFSTTATLTGATTPVAWTAQGLPPGLSINQTTGAITGTPTTAGSYNVLLAVIDTAGSSDTQAINGFVINPALAITAPASLPTWTAGVAYPAGVTATATGGTGTRSWTMSGQPTGLVINSTTGAITGTPTQTGLRPVTITVTDTVLATASVTLNVMINAAPSIPAGFDLPNWTVNRPYSETVTVNGGTGPFAWTATGLPAGLTINATTGVVSGIPTATGTSPSVQLRATDAAGAVAIHNLNITINAVPSVSTSTLPNGTVGAGYTSTVAATGGTTPFAWSATGLPAGLSINASTGTISGTPTTAGTSSVVVTVTDDAGATAQRTLSLTVIQPLTITGPTTLQPWTEDVAYPSVTATSVGGTGTRTWSATGLTFTGMSINSSTGVISGTPVNNGTINFTIRVQDSTGAFDTQALSLVVNNPPAISTSWNFPSWTVNAPNYSATPPVSAGTAPFTWTATGLPNGLTMSSAGVVTGTPTQTGTRTVTLRVTDAAGVVDTETASITINSALTIDTTIALPRNRNNQRAQLVDDGTPDYVITSPNKPTWVTFLADGRIEADTPNNGNVYTFTVTATDEGGATVTATVTLDLT